MANWAMHYLGEYNASVDGTEEQKGLGADFITIAMAQVQAIY